MTATLRSPTLSCDPHYAELQAVTDLVADGPWCWATRAVDALREMKVLVNQGREVGENDEVADPGVLAEQVRRYCAATVIGARDTAARPSKLMKEGSPGTDVDHPGDFSWGRSSSMGPQESMTRASAALAEWKP